MSRDVLILAPRLDTMFKKGPVPNARGPIPPIRIPWKNFVKNVAAVHTKRGDNVRIIELPLWQFSPSTVMQFKPDLAYIPHKQKAQFSCPNIPVRYYMQMVFPWMFSVDPKGWCAGADHWPIDPHPDPKTSHFLDLQKRTWRNESKFAQPAPDPLANEKLPSDPFLFFPCQIPHDETIKYHSNVEVIQALQATIDFGKHIGMQVVVKSHPVNPGSMEALKAVTKQNGNAIWVDNISIHDILRRCHSVFTVNSGVGMEALLHNKPVYLFGRSDYQSVCYFVGEPTVESIERHWLNNSKLAHLYPGFIHEYMETHYNTEDPADFDKLPDSPTKELREMVHMHNKRVVD